MLAAGRVLSKQNKRFINKQEPRNPEKKKNAAEPWKP